MSKEVSWVVQWRFHKDYPWVDKEKFYDKKNAEQLYQIEATDSHLEWRLVERQETMFRQNPN